MKKQPGLKMSDRAIKIGCVMGAVLIACSPIFAEDIEKYLEWERQSLTNSIRVMEQYQLNIIPTPKTINIQEDKLFILPERTILVTDAGPKSCLAAKMINRALMQLNGCSLPVRRDEEIKELAADTDYLMLVDNKNSLLKDLLPNGLPDNIRRPQGYLIETIRKNHQTIVVMTGSEETSMLYAAVTFCKLLKKESNGVYVHCTRIMDWPDMKYRATGNMDYFFRCRFRYARPAGNAEKIPEGEDYLDFLTAHKINFTAAGAVIDDTEEYTPEMRAWYKKLNTYAAERGIRIRTEQAWNVGTVKRHKGNPLFKDCLESRGCYYCWSNEKLLDDRCKTLTQFLKETGFGLAYFHCLEADNERWEDRCAACRAKYGDDRAAADAFVVNHLYKACREAYPDIIVSFVFRPYAQDLSKPDKYEKGSLAFYQKLTRLIPQDVSINRRETSHDDLAFWKTIIRQPIHFSPYHRYGFGTASGQLNRPTYTMMKGYYFGDQQGEDILQFEAGWPEDDVAVAGFAEYAWNVNSPGAQTYPMNLGSVDFTNQAAHAFFRENLLPGGFTDPSGGYNTMFQRICEEVYGNDLGNSLLKTFQGSIDKELINRPDAYIWKLNLFKTLGTNDDLCGWMLDQYRQCSRAFDALYDFYHKIKDGKKMDIIPGRYPDLIYFLQEVAGLRAISRVNACKLTAEKLFKSKHQAEAKLEVAKAIGAADEEEQFLKKLERELKDEPALYPYNKRDFAPIFKSLDELKNKLMPSQTAESAPKSGATHESNCIMEAITAAVCNAAGKCPVMIDIVSKKRNDELLDEGAVAFLFFKIKLSTFILLSEVGIVGRVYNADNMRLLKEATLASLPEIKECWESDELNIKTIDCPNLILIISVTSKQGQYSQRVPFK